MSLSQGNPLNKVAHLKLLSRWLRSQHLGHHIRLFILLSAGTLIKLLDISEKERTCIVSFLALASEHTIKVPEDLQRFGDQGISAEDATPGKIGLQSLKDDHVGGNEQKRLRIVAGNLLSLTNRVHELPHHGQGHHFGFAASCRHFDAVAGKVVVWRETDILKTLGVAFEKSFADRKSTRLNSSHLVISYAVF